MEHIAPLLQTILWVGLIAGIVWRFHAPIHGLLTALQGRVESGSNLKAGPFEISGLQPQPPEVQRAKAAAEVQEAIEETVVLHDPDPVQAQNLHRLVQSKYFQSEDLVFRALQAEYGVPISRNLVAAGGTEFDGVFSSNGRPNVVEIKYVGGASASITRLKDSLLRVRSAVLRLWGRSAQLIIAVVCENEASISSIRAQIEELFSGDPSNIVVRTYTLNELRQKFGLNPE